MASESTNTTATVDYVKNYNKACTNFKKSFTRMVKDICTKLNGMAIKTKSFNDDELTVENNTIHMCSSKNGLNRLTIKYPQGEFISTIIFSTAKSGPIMVEFPSTTVFVGTEKLEFFPAENWELNIHNGRVVGARLYANK